MIINIPENVKDAIANATRETGVPEHVLTAFAWVESGFRPAVISGDQTSPTAVKGLFQITGATWATTRPGTSYSLDVNEQAITAGLIIKRLLRKYNDDLNLACIGYNAGEGVADRIMRGESIESAVGYYQRKGTAGFGSGKVAEVRGYPIKLAQALGGTIATVPSVANNPSLVAAAPSGSSDVSTSVPSQSSSVDPERPFIENLFAGTSQAVASVATISKESMEKSELVSRLRAAGVGG